MSGVWVFKNGVVHLSENQNDQVKPNPTDHVQPGHKTLVYIPTNEVICSYASLEEILLSIGWKRYHNDPNLLQFQKPSSIDIISLPIEFSSLKSLHMYEISVKNPNCFMVKDM